MFIAIWMLSSPPHPPPTVNCTLVGHPTAENPRSSHEHNLHHYRRTRKLVKCFTTRMLASIEAECWAWPITSPGADQVRYCVLDCGDAVIANLVNDHTTSWLGPCPLFVDNSSESTTIRFNLSYWNRLLNGTLCLARYRPIASANSWHDMLETCLLLWCFRHTLSLVLQAFQQNSPELLYD